MTIEDKTGYKYQNETVIDCEKLNEHDLMMELAHRFEDYDNLKDEELCILGEHPNRDFWDDELEQKYDDLIIDIDNAWCRIREVMRIIYKNPDYKVC